MCLPSGSFLLADLSFNGVGNQVNNMLDSRMERRHPLSHIAWEVSKCDGHMKLTYTLKVMYDP